MLPRSALGRQALALGALYVVGYLALTTLVPPPATPAGRILLCGLLLAPPAGLALLATAWRARRAVGALRTLWSFLCAACALHALSVALFFARGLPPPRSALVDGLGLFAHHGSFLLLAVGLLARPDRPRGSGGLRASQADLAKGVCVAFLVGYFVILPPRSSPWPSFLLHAAEDILPAVLAVVLARRVAPPDDGPYRVLAAGLTLAAAFSVPGNWLYANGRYAHYGPLDVAWMIPYWALVVAAVSARPPWLAAAPAREKGRSAVALDLLLVPPLVDLAVRASGPPGDAPARALLALSAFAALCLLAGLRLRSASRETAGEVFDPGPEGSPDLLRLATGTAHELNNPLMAVVLASELAVARGGSEPPLRDLQAAVHAAAAAIRRFQLVASGQPVPREGE